jgi:hypothetical protein
MNEKQQNSKFTQRRTWYPANLFHMHSSEQMLHQDQRDSNASQQNPRLAKEGWFTEG